MFWSDIKDLNPLLLVSCWPLFCLLDYSSDWVRMMLHTENQLPRLGGVSGEPNFFLQISSSWVKIRLHAENHLPRLPGSALKVCVVVGGVGSSPLWGHTNFFLG